MGPVHLIRICELEHQQKDFVVLFLACLLRQDVLRLAQRRQACRTELHDSRGLGPEVGILRRYTSMDMYNNFFFKVFSVARLVRQTGKRHGHTLTKSRFAELARHPHASASDSPPDLYRILYIGVRTALPRPRPAATPASAMPDSARRCLRPNRHRDRVARHWWHCSRTLHGDA